MYDCCFGSENGCTALNNKKCEGCKFYKTEEEYADGIAKSKDRLIHLGRDDLLEKYKIGNGW